MRVLLSLGRLCLLVVALAATSQGQSQVIRGWVADEDGKPLPGIGVEFRDAQNAQVLDKTVSDYSGYFNSHDLPSGTYKLRFWDELGAVKGYTVLPEYYGAGDTEVFCQGADIVLEPGATFVIQHQILTLVPCCVSVPTDLYVLTGFVSDGVSGEPLSGMRVEMIDSSNGVQISTVLTDASGAYVFKQYSKADAVTLRFSDLGSDYYPQFLGAGGKDEFCLAQGYVPGSSVANASLLPVTPAGQTQQLEDEIEALPLPTQVENLLSTPLTRAAELLTDTNSNNDSAVCHQLDSFITRVHVQEMKGQLTPLETANLVDMATEIQLSLGCD